jgi:hypothetical protein
MTARDLLEAHGGEWIRWALPMIFAAGMGWTLLKSLPQTQEKVQSHDIRLAVVETKLGNIEAGIGDIKESLRGERRSRGVTALNRGGEK